MELQKNLPTYNGEGIKQADVNLLGLSIKRNN